MRRCVTCDGYADMRAGANIRGVPINPTAEGGRRIQGPPVVEDVWPIRKQG